ncbi:hypothetical protein [Streptomyces brasiliensis]|uniref:Uncharacterized protein n=1 Tax=Streptomyces brasiliensis TaxID=1954 RepID=A0A917LAJ2_9ACTN|nr:hypothetical protein [Streptomyces brasiliensis]GGJ56046.1 hypothetical protein GCM10010121_078290 [Streptomyces brasiliensis]
MGFSGHLVFGRSERSLLEASAFNGIHRELKETVHAWPPRPQGWQTLQLDHGLWEEEDLCALVECTGQAACVADVYDSDVALVTGMSADGQNWQACLNLQVAAALWAEEPEDLYDQSMWVNTPEFNEAVQRKRAELDAEVPTSAQGALAWAAAAGVGDAAGQSEIEDLLRSQQTFVEELFDALLDRLGFPEAAQR